MMNDEDRRSFRRIKASPSNRVQQGDDDDQTSLLQSSDESNDRNFIQLTSSSVSSLKGDYGSIFLLLILYILQGIPLGLSGSIPLILQNYKVSYSQQAVFSLVTWPFSLKLLWAPLVDSVYNRRFGRRKSWLIPTQYFIGLGLFILSYYIESLLGPLPRSQGTKDSSEESVTNPVSPNVYILTVAFFIINFLCATQDIAVDGWALTMLSKRNVVYASTCNTVGQTIGFALGYLVFLALESPEVCNKYLRSIPQNEGLVTLPGFLHFWSIIFLITTTLVWLLKREKRDGGGSRDEMSVVNTYKMLYKILKLKSIQSFALILLTCKICFAITDSGTPLKLAEAGMTKEALAFLSVPLLPLQIILPWYLSKYTKGPKPLHIFIKSYPFRIFCGILNAGLLIWTKSVRDPVTNTFPSYYYLVVIAAAAVHQVSIYCIYVALLSFHARVSDPSIGGTYMTLLNTITNLGGNWPSFISLWLLDVLTFKKCSIPGFDCNNQVESKLCKTNGGECLTTVDGYYVEVAALTLVGFVWLKWARSRIEKIESLPPSSWRCSQSY